MSIAPLLHQRLEIGIVPVRQHNARGDEKVASGSPLLRQTLANLPEGTWELVCHPGYNDGDLGAVATRLRDSRDEERRLLTSNELRGFLEEQKIRVIGYREFADEGA